MGKTVDGERLSDIVRFSDVGEVAALLARMSQHFRAACEWIRANARRTTESVALHHLLWSAANYLEIAANGVETHVSVFALATRNLYELRLRIEHLTADPANLGRWQAEAATDKIQVLEGILGIQGGRDGAPRAILTDEIARLRALLDRHGMHELKRITSTASIAQQLRRDDEHQALFKLLSKLVHPSSYLVNDYQNAASPEIRQILQVHCQLYAWELFNRTCEALAVPDAVRSFKGSDGA